MTPETGSDGTTQGFSAHESRKGVENDSKAQGGERTGGLKNEAQDVLFCGDIDGIFTDSPRGVASREFADC